MTDLSCKTIMAVNEFSICYNAAPKAGSQRNHNEIFHSFCCAEQHFTERCGIRIIC